MRRTDRATAALLILAALLAMAQFVSAFFVHVAARARPTPSGWVAPPTKTYIQTFGVSEVILTSLSLAAIVVVASVLSRRTMRGQSGAGWLAWGVSVVAAVLGLVGFVYLFGAGCAFSWPASPCRAVIPWPRSARPVRARPSSR